MSSPQATAFDGTPESSIPATHVALQSPPNPAPGAREAAPRVTLAPEALRPTSSSKVASSRAVRSPILPRKRKFEPEVGGLLGRSSSPLGGWETLDRQIASLPQNPEGFKDRIDLHGFVKVTGGRYFLQGSPRADREMTGFSLDSARLSFEGQLSDVRVKVAVDGGTRENGGYILKTGEGGSLLLLDAYASYDLDDWVTLQVGQFRHPVLFSALNENNELLFLNRTFNGLNFQTRDLGAMLFGRSGPAQWWLAVQNGVDGVESDVAATARLALRVFGEGEAPRREGAFDADLGQTLYLAGVYFRDGHTREDAAFGGEAYYTWERLSLSTEAMNYGSGLLDQTFWSATASFMVVPDRWELAARYEDFDQRADRLYKLGLNRYLDGGASRVQANVSRFESKEAGDFSNLFEIGLVTSF